VYCAVNSELKTIPYITNRQVATVRILLSITPYTVRQSVTKVRYFFPPKFLIVRVFFCTKQSQNYFLLFCLKSMCY